MGIRSASAVVGLLLLAACGGSEFSAANGESGGTTGEGGRSGTTGGTAGAAEMTGGSSQGPSGGAGMTMGSGGASRVDASVTGGSGGKGGGGAVADASIDVGAPEATVVPTCPMTEPAGGGACSGILKCTYGTHPRIGCRKTYTCTAGHWAVGAATMCSALPACTDENPLPFIGAVCTSVGHDCLWESGLYCRCVACPDMGCPNWNCFPPPNNCGTTPPNLGQACTADTMPAVCEFGNCALGSRVTVTCVNGVINWTFPNCQ